MIDPTEFDPALFKSDARQAQEREEAEARSYEMYERVLLPGGGCGVIIEETTTNGITSYLVEDENKGYKNWHKKWVLRKTEQLPVKEEMTFRMPYKVGEIVRYHGHNYRVVSAFEISDAEAADAEDANDVFAIAGPYAKAVLIP